MSDMAQTKGIYIYIAQYYILPIYILPNMGIAYIVDINHQLVNITVDDKNPSKIHFEQLI